ATGSVHMMHRVLSQAMKQAVKWQLLAQNPCDAVSPPRVERKQMSGNATNTRPYADGRIIVNFSVWESVYALERFVWQTVHKRFYGRRTDWFEHFEGPSVVLWWVPAGHRPSVEEATGRMEHLKQHGPSDHAFDWQAASAQLWKTARCAPAGQVA